MILNYTEISSVWGHYGTQTIAPELGSMIAPSMWTRALVQVKTF